jgi:hypothetical protein
MDEEIAEPKIIEEAIIEKNEPGDNRSKVFLDSKEILTVIKDNREEIRVIIGSLLRINGLLLTASLGILYFTLKDSKIADIPIPTGFTNLIFLISGLLLVSIILCLISVFSKPPKTADRRELQESLEKIYSNETRLTKISIVLIIISISLFIVSLIRFAEECNHNNILLNPVLDAAIIISIIYKYVSLLI